MKRNNAPMFAGFCVLATVQAMGLRGWIPIPTWLVWVIWTILGLMVVVWLATGQIKVTQAMKTAFFWLWTAGVVVGLFWLFTTFSLVFETGAVAFGLAVLTLWVRVITMSDKIGGDLKTAYDHMTEALKSQQVFTFDEIEELLASKMSIPDIQARHLKFGVISQLSAKNKARVDRAQKKITRI